MVDGLLNRAQLVAAAWGLFGVYAVATGGQDVLANGAGAFGLAYVAFGAFAFGLAGLYVMRPDRVDGGREPAGLLAELVVAAAAVFVVYVLAFS